MTKRTPAFGGHSGLVIHWSFWFGHWDLDHLARDRNHPRPAPRRRRPRVGRQPAPRAVPDLPRDRRAGALVHPGPADGHAAARPGLRPVPPADPLLRGPAHELARFSGE